MVVYYQDNIQSGRRCIDVIRMLEEVRRRFERNFTSERTKRSDQTKGTLTSCKTHIPPWPSETIRDYQRLSETYSMWTKFNLISTSFPFPRALDSFGQELLTRPPAAQAATRPYLPPSFSSLLAAVVTSRTPVAPNGWPIDSEPPHVLNLSIGGTPTCKVVKNRRLWVGNMFD